jgi:hypothetical protein
VKIAPPSARSMRRPLPLAQRKLRPGLPRTVNGRGGAPVPSIRPAAGPAPATPPVAPTPRPIAEGNRLTLRGGFWEITYEGRTGIVEDCRGLHYVALLMQGAGPERGPIHAKELAARVTGDGGATELELKDDVLDTVARRQFIERLQEVASERERACAAEDFERAEALDSEYERIATELSRARSSRKGARRTATFSDAAEKARKAVGKAITEAVARIASHPDLSPLAEHLSSSIRKGQWLSYTGNREWHIDLRPSLPRK